MRKYIFLMVIMLIPVILKAQDNTLKDRKMRFPVWITHSNKSDIIGLSFAAFPKGVFKNDTTLARTYGIRVEASLVAVLSPLMPRSPISTNDRAYVKKQNATLDEIVYGINLSTGTFGQTKVHGFSGGLFMQYLYNLNGIALTGMGNLIENHNGVGISALGNDIYKSNGILIGFGNSVSKFNGIQIGGFNDVLKKGVGLQLGIFNTAQNFKGIQLGLWNKNEKRSLPFINWNFKGS